MIENFELVIVTTIILILMFIGFLPLIYLKYCKDLNNNVELYNTICNNNKNVYIQDKQIKNTYMWNISNFLFEFDKLERYFNISNEGHTTDKKSFNHMYSIIDGQFNIMKIYNDYLHYNIPLFIILWIIFLLNIYNIVNSYGKYENNINEDNIYYLYSTLFAFFNVAIFTIIFSFILKKITEIYKDTNLYDYIMLLKELDIIIKEDKQEENKNIITFIKKYSGNNIKSVRELSLNEKFIRELINIKNENKTLSYSNSKNYKLTLEDLNSIINENKNEDADIIKIIKKYSKDKIKPDISLLSNNNFIKEFNSLIEKISYSNSKNYKLTLENLEKLEYYNNKVNIDNINEKFDSITRFIPAYIILIFMSIYILSKCLKSNFTTISFIIILIYTFLISTYTIKKHLE
jgi:hypothetical protein